ncbi:hypothetical protein RI367_007843 [Sorochytrium milnesiophthora]
MSLQHFSAQVAGHDALLTRDDGKLVKPCTVKEVRFYEELHRPDSRFSRLRDFVPAFHGQTALTEPPRPEWQRRGAVVLGNLLDGFRAPCVVDVKLGTQLYDDDADDAKRAKMVALAEATTSGSIGVRISGMTVRSSGNDAKVYGKAYGKSLVADTVYTAFLEYTSMVATRSGRMHVLRRIRTWAQSLLDEMCTVEGQFVGCSLLAIFEGADAAMPRVEVRLIDFAHSTLQDGRGPDRQFLLGLHNAIVVLDKALEQLE